MALGTSAFDFELTDTGTEITLTVTQGSNQETITTTTSAGCMSPSHVAIYNREKTSSTHRSTLSNFTIEVLNQ